MQCAPLYLIQHFDRNSLALVFTVALNQTYLTFRHGVEWMLTMVLEYLFFANCISHKPSDGHAPSSRQIMFFSDASRGVLAVKHMHLYQCVRLLSHVRCLTDPSAGGRLTVSNNYSTALIGTHIFLVGLVLRLVSFISFSAIAVRFLLRVRTDVLLSWNRDSKEGWYDDWRTLAGALCISCVGILVRSGYRVAELSQTFHGSLSSTGSYFYGLDTLPLFDCHLRTSLTWPVHRSR
ncbi:hypothetical protein BDN67DRAFT_309217 [Paxillus ammoniavirescens]|nr:hypothetical protein BDN67DRAFT_309217 [Paxillus ammoniavirescens]